MKIGPKTYNHKLIPFSKGYSEIKTLLSPKWLIAACFCIAVGIDVPISNLTNLNGNKYAAITSVLNESDSEKIKDERTLFYNLPIDAIETNQLDLIDSSPDLNRIDPVAATSVTLAQSFSNSSDIELLAPCKLSNKQHTFYVPFPEEDLYWALRNASSCPQNLGNIVRSVTSIKTPYPTIYIKYDHWEDGYETNLTQPIQATTEIWGDGDLTNGVAPGHPSDVLVAGSSIILDNTFDYTPPRNTAIIAYDGKDKIVSSADVVLSKIAGDESFFTFQAAKTSVYDINRFGTSFTVPVGENLSNEFQYTALFVRALEDNTLVTIDVNADGVIDGNDVVNTINQGEVIFIEGDPNNVNQINDIKSGATVTASNNVGLDVLFGGLDCFGTRNVNLLPTSFYSNKYYTPVPTVNNNAPSRIYFHNIHDAAIDITWTNNIGTGTITVPASSTTDFLLPNVYSAFKFETLGEESFIAMEVIDSDDSGMDFDWAFSLIGDEQLTDFTSIAWAPGSIDGSRNDGPIWVAPTADTKLYIKHDGDVTAGSPFVSPCGRAYDLAVDLDELEVYQIRDDSDNDQSGTAIFTCDSTSFISVYGEDPSTALSGNPSMDVGTAMQPLCSERQILANDDVYYSIPDLPIDLSVLDNDDGFLITVDPNSIALDGLLQPTNGNVIINPDNSQTFFPNAGWQGIETFEYRICAVEDPTVCDVATVTLFVGDCEATPITVIINGFTYLESNPDNGAYDGEPTIPGIVVDLYFDVNGNGIIDAPEDQVVQTTTSNSSGYFTFTIRTLGDYIVKVNVEDGLHTAGILNNAIAQFIDFDDCVNGIYLGVQSIINAVDDSSIEEFNIPQNIDILNNDIGLIDYTSLNTDGLMQPSNGTITLESNNTITYIPNYEFVGIDSFEYQICSPEDPTACDIAVVHVTMTCAVLSDQNIVSGTVFYDEDGNGGFEIIESGQANAHVRLYQDLNTDGILDDEDVLLEYVITTGSGQFEFNPTITVFPFFYIIEIDRAEIPGMFFTNGNTENAYFENFGQADCVNNFGVLDCPDSCPPVANDDSASTFMGVSVVIDVLANDLDSNGDLDPASVSNPPTIMQPANGVISIDPVNGAITYIPSPIFNGIDSFEYQVCDLAIPTPNCDIALVTIAVSCPTILDDNIISGFVFNDLDGNGIYELGESGGGDVKVRLYLDENQNGIIDNSDMLLDSMFSSVDGSYSFSPNVLSAPETITIDIEQSANDAEERKSNGIVSTTGNDLEMGRDGNRLQWVGMNFSSIDIPQGALIQNAYIEFYAKGNTSLTTDLLIYGEDVDNSNVFANESNNISSRTKTPPVFWDDIPNWTDNNTYSTPSIASIVQSIIDRPNWTAGKNLSILVEGTGRRRAESFDGNGEVPRLVIEYTTTILPAYFLMSVDESTLPLGASLTTDNIEFTVFPFIGLNDCVNNFGFQSCPGGCAPIAIDDDATTNVGVAVVVDVLANDIDPDFNLDPSSVEIPINGIQPANGSTSINPTNGEITYFPNFQFSGLESFEYIICDQSSPVVKCDTALVRIKVVCPITPGQNIISGHVFNENGESNGGNILVYLYEDNNENGILDNGDVNVDSVFTNPDGSYAFSPTIYGATQSFQVDVVSSTDDAEESLADGGISISGSFLDLGIAASAGSQIIGMRFSSVAIPPDAIIQNAYIEFTASGDDDIATNLFIYGEDIDDAPAFNNENSNISNRNKTTPIEWNVPPWTSDISYNTPAINSVVQTIIDRPDWQSGNDVVIMIDGTGERSAYSFNSGNPAPKLIVEYVTAESPPEFPAHFLMTIDESTLPSNSELTTDNLETTIFNNLSESDCSNNFGFHICSGDCAPVAVDDSAITEENTSVNIDVVANDWDPDFDLDLTSINSPNGVLQPGNGTISINPNSGEITYTPYGGFEGLDAFEYIICDLSTPIPKCDTALVTVNVVYCNIDLDELKITGQLFIDNNLNGNNDDGGVGFQGAKIYLYADNDCSGTISGIDVVIDSTTTGLNGDFEFVKTTDSSGFPYCFVAQFDKASLPSVLESTTSLTKGLYFSIASICAKYIDFGAQYFVEANPDTSLMLTYSGFKDIEVLLNDLGNYGSPNIITPPDAATVLVNGDGTIRFMPDDDSLDALYQFTYEICSLDNPAVCDSTFVFVQVVDCDADVVEKIIRGKVFHDLNENGVNEAEIGIENVKVKIYQDVNQNGNVDGEDILLSTKITNPEGDYVYAFVSSSISAEDDFSATSYSDGTGPWVSDWIELDPDGNPGPIGNYLGIINEELAFHWTYQNSEIIWRSADLSGHTAASLSFDWRTVGLDVGESLSVQVSQDGNNFTTVGFLTGSQISSFTLDISGYISNNTTIRFLSDGPNWEGNEYAFIDNIKLEAKSDIQHFVIETDLASHPNGYGLTTDNIETSFILNSGNCDSQNNFGLNFFNTAPLAISDINATETNLEVTGNLLRNDQDLDNDSIMINQQPINVFGGSVVIESNGDYLFTPTQGFVGEAEFSYTIYDNGSPSLYDTAFVNIDILDGLSPSGNQISGLEDNFILENTNVLNSNLLANDNDLGDGSLLINTNPISAPIHGSLTINLDGTFSYFPNVGFVGTDKFSYEVCVDELTPICDTVSVHINLINELSIEANQINTYAIDDANLGMIGDILVGNVSLNDVDPLSIFSVDPIPVKAPENGSVIIDSDGNYSYIPASNFSGNDEFIYQICDGGVPLSCHTASVYLTLLDNRILLDFKVMLQGALYGSTDSLMRADLNSNNSLPLNQPYSSDFNPLFFNRFEHVIGGLEVTTNTVLSMNKGTHDDIVDWVFIELRNREDSTTVVQTVSALLQRDGDIVDATSGGNLYVKDLIGEFFVVVKHRNHLGVMTATPVSIIDKTIAADFTSMAAIALYNDENYEGLEQATFAGMNALWAGNAYPDTKVKYDGSTNDRIILVSEIISTPGNVDANLNYNNSIGYYQGDINMDGKAKHDGILNDRILLQNIILTYPENYSFLNNYNLLLEQVKY